MKGTETEGGGWGPITLRCGPAIAGVGVRSKHPNFFSSAAAVPPSSLSSSSSSSSAAVVVEDENENENENLFVNSESGNNNNNNNGSLEAEITSVLSGPEREKEEQEGETIDMYALEEELKQQLRPHVGSDGLVHLSAVFKPSAPLRHQIFNATHRSPQAATVHQKRSGEPRE